jgi:hypothetical protein
MTANLKFESTLEFGKVGESKIERWLRKAGITVLPTYDILPKNGKGPRIYLPTGTLIAPDFLAWWTTKGLWIEAKHKTAFTKHRITGDWVTGIDLRYYADYLKVQEQSPWPVWLLFLHGEGCAKDSPPGGPTGLYGNDLTYLRNHEHHRHVNGGRGGMVYWAERDLKKFDSFTLDD